MVMIMRTKLGSGLPPNEKVGQWLMCGKCLNIIKNLWGILKQEVKKHMFKHGQVRDRESFDELQEKWSQIPFETIVNTYNS